MFLNFIKCSVRKEYLGTNKAESHYYDASQLRPFTSFASAQLPVRCKRHPRCLCKRSDVSVKSANVQLI
ncbi:hypothetical protein OUZ56_015828 [Daphnia magna]|uniref:Uncharacterized protein n=1 Tax=Daphnia magna TaxID=35525 RepID=A0ABR0ANV7_9CRUS|nr:hypothetical protein OUZ56_015828 [Daphnia magna]